MKKIVILISAIVLTGCMDDSQVASKNVSKAANNFEVDRRIVFYNGINGEYMLSIEGKCSIEPNVGYVSVICKTGASDYKKHFLGLSDNVTYIAEQLETINVSAYRYRVTFKPESIVPDIDLRTSSES